MNNKYIQVKIVFRKKSDIKFKKIRNYEIHSRILRKIVNVIEPKFEYNKESKAKPDLIMLKPSKRKQCDNIIYGEFFSQAFIFTSTHFKSNSKRGLFIYQGTCAYIANI